MSDQDPVLLRPWVAIGGGLLAGAAAAFAVMAVWTALRDEPGDGIQVIARPDRMIPHFRAATATHEIMLVPAGPDGTGELALSRAAYPGEEPPRRLVEVVLANVSRNEAWEVDLAATPLRTRVGESDAWSDLTPVQVDDSLPKAARLRARSLGAGVESFRVEPGSLRRVLLALPPGQQFEALSGVQWGEQTFGRGEFGVEELYAFREDPAATGRRPTGSALTTGQERSHLDRPSIDEPGPERPSGD